MLTRPLIATATVLAMVVLLYLTVTASAFHCPVDMGKIDAALPTAELNDQDKSKVMALRAQGEELHNSGNHAEAVKVLAEAMTLLGVK